MTWPLFISEYIKVRGFLIVFDLSDSWLNGEDAYLLASYLIL